VLSQQEQSKQKRSGSRGALRANIARTNVLHGDGRARLVGGLHGGRSAAATTTNKNRMLERSTKTMRRKCRLDQAIDHNTSSGATNQGPALLGLTFHGMGDTSLECASTEMAA
jgi:hypothetical protein